MTRNIHDILARDNPVHWRDSELGVYVKNFAPEHSQLQTNYSIRHSDVRASIRCQPTAFCAVYGALEEFTPHSKRKKAKDDKRRNAQRTSQIHRRNLQAPCFVSF